MKGLKSIVFVTAIVLLLLAVGCSSAASPTASPPTTTPAQPASQLPLGTYANEKTSNGPEKLTLMDGGQFTQIVTFAGRLIEGTWTPSPDHVTFTETKGGDCSGTPGNYTWAFDGKALTFTKVQDDCSQRSGDLPSGPWIKQP